MEMKKTLDVTILRHYTWLVNIFDKSIAKKLDPHSIEPRTLWQVREEEFKQLEQTLIDTYITLREALGNDKVRAVNKLHISKLDHYDREVIRETFFKVDDYIFAIHLQYIDHSLIDVEKQLEESASSVLTLNKYFTEKLVFYDLKQLAKTITRLSKQVGLSLADRFRLLGMVHTLKKTIIEVCADGKGAWDHFLIKDPRYVHDPERTRVEELGRVSMKFRKVTEVCLYLECRTVNGVDAEDLLRDLGFEFTGTYIKLLNSEIWLVKTYMPTVDLLTRLIVKVIESKQTQKS